MTEYQLADVGCVGANHQQFAVRHIDDAHQTKGDRQPQGRQQQHATERDTVEQLTDKFRYGQMLL